MQTQSLSQLTGRKTIGNQKGMEPEDACAEYSRAVGWSVGDV